MPQGRIEELRGRFLLATTDAEREAAYKEAVQEFSACGADPRELVSRELGVVLCALVAEDGRWLGEYDRRARRWQVIGGKIERQDRSAAAAAEREVLEECGPPGESAVVELRQIIAPTEKIAVSPSTGDVTRYEFSWFHVSQVSWDLPPVIVSSHGRLAWQNAASLLAESTAWRSLTVQQQRRLEGLSATSRAGGPLSAR